jgi:hypothetical protein
VATNVVTAFLIINKRQKQKIMRVLYISGDDDYHFLTFEQQDEYSIEEIVDICEKSADKEHRFEIEDTHFDAKLYEFGTVDEKFIEFIKSTQDYDDCKHNNWLIID